MFDSLMKTSTKMSDNIFAVGGECENISIIDIRELGTAMKIRINDYCTNIKKIYPFGVLLSCGKNIKIYDIRMYN